MKQKLELTWVGKHDHKRPEPRILLQDPALSRHAPAKVTDNDIFDNVLIQGDNLLALKALEQDYLGQVKCIFIDPPYNTGSAFEHYDDGLEHSLWLTMMRDRLELLKKLLANDGSIWISVDDNEAHYLKVLCDEIFGRNNFVANVIWEKTDSPRMDAVFFSSRHDHVFVYAKNKEQFIINRILQDENDTPRHYDRVGETGRKYYLKPLRSMGIADTRAARPSMYFPLSAPDGTFIYPKKQDGTDGRWRWSKEKAETDFEKIEWVNGRNGWSPSYRIYADNSEGRPPETIWSHSEVGSNRTSKSEIKKLFPDSIQFDTPKPERLLERIIHLATQPGDLVLDSFAGSGTTGAVAHKMGRRWIMIELGDHAHTHIVPRLEKVVNGTDAGGITGSVGWKGGGGFRYYRLAPSLLELDRFGQWVINKSYDAAMLSQAMCKLEGFKYEPSDSVYWIHGRSSETDFLYITTQNLSADQLRGLSEEVGDKRSLLICCRAFRAPTEDLPNLTVKKIPKAVLERCEWGRDDYSLAVALLPEMPKPKPPADKNLFDLLEDGAS